MTSKLTLSVDPAVVVAAKQYAAEAGTSVSRLVEDYLAALAATTRPPSTTPILSRLRGSMRDTDIADWERHLAEKYG